MSILQDLDPSTQRSTPNNAARRYAVIPNWTIAEHGMWILVLTSIWSNRRGRRNNLHAGRPGDLADKTEQLGEEARKQFCRSGENKTKCLKP